jgi:hypothetical protein
MTRHDEEETARDGDRVAIWRRAENEGPAGEREATIRLRGDAAGLIVAQEQAGLR